MAFDAWSTLGVIGGGGALTYLAVRPDKSGSKKTALRLSLKDDSLLLDVRLLGGVLTGVGSYWVKNQDAKKVMETVAVASFASLLSTEIVRWKMAKDGYSIGSGYKYIPSWEGYGAAPAPQRQRQGAWAS